MPDNSTPKHHHNKMGTEPIGKLLLSMSLPAMFSMLIQALYNIVDSIYVAQIGEHALTAVSLAFPVQNLMIAVSVGTGVGLNSLISRRLGERREKEASAAATHGVLISFAESLLFLLFGLFFCRMFFSAFTNDPTVIQMGVEYTSIVTIFSFGCFIEINLEKTLQATGNMFYPMVFQLIGAISNIILDPIFIFGLGLGTSGAAIATGLSQFISFCILLAQCNLRRECIHIRIGNFRPSLFLYGKILSGGLPSLTRQGMASIATIVLNTTAHPFGDAAIAAMAIVNRLIYFVNSAVIGFGQGFQPVCGFSYGARKYSRVRQAYWFCVKFTTCILVVVCAGGFLVSGHVISLFRKNDPEVIAIGTLALRLQIATMWMNGFLTMSNMMSQSIGYGFRATLLAISRQGLFLIPVLLIAAHFLGLLGIQLAQPVADIATLVLTLVIIRGIFREFNKLEGL